MNYETILFGCAGGIARITLNRPECLNALSRKMFQEMHAALDLAQAMSDLRVVVLTGAGRGFCAGADLTEPFPIDVHGARDLGVPLERDYNPLVLRLRGLPVPVISVVNGVAAGAGVSLALAADITLASRSASFVLAFARLGLIPDAGSTYFLAQRIGMARAMGLALLGEKISGIDAATWGLVWKCVEDHELGSVAEQLANHFASAPTRALGLTKKAFNASSDRDLAAQLELERELQKTAGATADFEEGLASFLAKRPAHFTGR